MEYTGDGLKFGEFSGDSDEHGNWIFGVYKTEPNGRYAGNFQNFKRHGFGAMNYSNGDSYLMGLANFVVFSGRI